MDENNLNVSIGTESSSEFNLINITSSSKTDEGQSTSEDEDFSKNFLLSNSCSFQSTYVGTENQNKNNSSEEFLSLHAIIHTIKQEEKKNWI